MKCLGMIGGTSWHSTIEYYRYINETTNRHFGDNTNPPTLLFTLNQSQIHQLQTKGDWEAIVDLFLSAGNRLQQGGAEGLIFCANTAHKIYEEVESKIEVPIIHICDAASNGIRQTGSNTVGLIGTRFSMEETFLIDRFAKNGIQAIVPDSGESIEELHRIVHEELSFGNVVPNSKQYVLKVIQSLIDRGAEGIVLGCTEFPIMIAPTDVDVPTFNTTELHSLAAVEFMLS